jgi:hypothetical protein
MNETSYDAYTIYNYAPVYEEGSQRYTSYAIVNYYYASGTTILLVLYSHNLENIKYYLVVSGNDPTSSVTIRYDITTDGTSGLAAFAIALIVIGSICCCGFVVVAIYFSTRRRAQFFSTHHHQRPVETKTETILITQVKIFFLKFS